MIQSQKFDIQKHHVSRASYENEVDLIKTVTDNIEVFIPAKPFVVSKEMTIGAGTVDVVLGEAKPNYLVERLKSPSPIRGVEAVVLSHLYLRKPLRVSTIASRTGLDEKIALKSLEKLLEYGLCSKRNSGTFLRSPSTEHFKSLITIEGKLRSWKRALYQASRNRFFSTRSFVVLDAKHSRPAIANLILFKKSGVGLAIADADSNTVQIVLDSGRAPFAISSLYQFLAYEELTYRVANKNAFLSEDLRAQIH